VTIFNLGSERSTRHSSDSTAAQLVTTQCFSRRSTRHTILGCDELTVWRVDWQPILSVGMSRSNYLSNCHMFSRAR